MNNLTIHKLTPEHLDDYIYFFENVAHTDNKKWDRCYCTNFCAANNSRVLKRQICQTLMLEESLQ